MSRHAVNEDLMGRPKSTPKIRNVKITKEAYEVARIASGFTGDSIVDFISHIVSKHGNQVIDEQIERRKLAMGSGENPPTVT